MLSKATINEANTQKKNREIIIVFVTSIKMGVGGHFFSAKTYAEEASKHKNVHLISVGPNYSKVIKNAKIKQKKHFHLKRINIISVIMALFRYFKENRINRDVAVIHCFDENCYLFGRLLSWLFKIPIVLTKCGGPNPTKYYPKASSLTTFSRENHEYFCKKNYRSYYIPNRVKKPIQNHLKIRYLRELIEWREDDIVVLRVGRMCESYERLTLTCIKYFSQFNKCKLVFVGAIQDEKVYKKIIKLKTSSCFVITDSLLTSNASEILDIADVIVGTGRSFIEGCSLGKIMMTTSNFEPAPILIDKFNFESTLSYNFSPRWRPHNKTNIDFIKTVQNTKNSMTGNTYKEFMMNYFNDYLDVKKSIELYDTAYKNANYADLRIFDFIMNYLVLMKRCF